MQCAVSAAKNSPNAKQIVNRKPKGLFTDKKENRSFLIYKEIQMGSGAKSYMRKGFLKYEEMLKNFPYI